MKQYPSIPRELQNIPVYAFDKLDGSNIRTEWHPKKGLWKFGSRTQLIDETSPLGEAIGLINQHSEAIHKELRDMGAEGATLFFEFFGASSFAGTHYDETHRVSLIDVSIYKKGFMNPGDFNKSFKEIPKAGMLYYGNCNREFVEAVKTGNLEGMTFEGVVCKASRAKASHSPIMFKVKNQAWIEKLRSTVPADQFEVLL
jgi:hypothetical protein